MAETPRTWMRKALQKHLIPEFQKRGFELVPLPKTASREEKSYNALGILKRRTPRGIEQVEVVLDKPLRVGFAVRFGLVPLGGMMFGEVYYRADEIPVDWLHDDYELSARPRNAFTAWWRVWRWPWQTKKPDDYEHLAKRVATLIPEIEDVFATGKIGPHVRYMDMRNAPGAGKIVDGKP